MIQKFNNSAIQEFSKRDDDESTLFDDRHKQASNDNIVISKSAIMHPGRQASIWQYQHHTQHQTNDP